MSRKSRKPQAAERPAAEILRQADQLLTEIRVRQAEMSALEAEMLERIAKIQAEYEEELTPYRVLLAGADMALLRIMKTERKILFEKTDVVNLASGSLIRSEGTGSRSRGMPWASAKSWALRTSSRPSRASTARPSRSGPTSGSSSSGPKGNRRQNTATR